MLIFCKYNHCGDPVQLISEGVGPTIQYLGTCKKCGVKWTVSKDARTGKVTESYYDPKRDTGDEMPEATSEE